MAAAVLGATVPGLMGEGQIAILTGTVLAALLAALFLAEGSPSPATVVTALVLAVVAVILTISGFTLLDIIRAEATIGDGQYVFLPDAPEPPMATRGSMSLYEYNQGDIDQGMTGGQNLTGKDVGYWKQWDGQIQKKVLVAAPGSRLSPAFTSTQPEPDKCREVLGDRSETSYDLNYYPSGVWFCAATSGGNIAALRVYTDVSSNEDKIEIDYILSTP